MVPSKILAAAFEDEIVMLHVDRGSLMKLDAAAASVWRACGGATAQTIARTANVGETRVMETLRALAEAGIVQMTAGRWARAPVTWVP